MCLSCFFWCVFFTYQNVFLCNFEKSYSSRFFFKIPHATQIHITCFALLIGILIPDRYHPKLFLLVHVVWVQLMICVLCVCWRFFKLMLTGIVCWNMLRNTHTHQRRLIYSSSVVVVTSFPTPLDMVTEGQIHLNI